MCSARWSGCLMLPFRLTLLKCESDQVWLVIWPRRQGAEGFSESQSAACGTSVQERSQEAFGVLSLELTGWPTKFEIFLAPYFHCHLLFFFFFFLQYKNFLFQFRKFHLEFCVFFFSLCSSLLLPFRKRQTKELLMGHSLSRDLIFEFAFGIHNLQCWQGLSNSPPSGEKTTGKWGISLSLTPTWIACLFWLIDFLVQCLNCWVTMLCDKCFVRVFSRTRNLAGLNE